MGSQIGSGDTYRGLPCQIENSKLYSYTFFKSEKCRLIYTVLPLRVPTSTSTGYTYMYEIRSEEEKQGKATRAVPVGRLMRPERPRRTPSSDSAQGCRLPRRGAPVPLLGEHHETPRTWISLAAASLRRIPHPPRWIQRWSLSFSSARSCSTAAPQLCALRRRAAGGAFSPAPSSRGPTHCSAPSASTTGVSLSPPSPTSICEEKRGESRRLGFGRGEEVFIYLCFLSNGSDSSEVHPTAGIYRAT
jgi:hypothetical protein